MPARAVIIATGAQYRRLALDNLAQFEGAGVYYGATFVEAQLCGGEEVIVVGGGNSAGQAAVFLAQTARRVYMLVRSGGLAESMSRYLIRRIEENPAIELRTQTEIVALEGGDRLERVRWRNAATGRGRDARSIRHVFVMTGAVPNTGWLDGCVALDANGFIKTGPDLSPDDLTAARWPLPRAAAPARDEPARASSPSATCAAATSSASRRPSARDRSPSPSSTRCCTNRSTAVTDLPDFDLHRTTSESDLPTPPARPVGVWIAVALLIVAAGAAAYVAFSGAGLSPPAQSARATPAAAAPSASPPLGGKGDAITLPPLDASDTLVRTLVQGLTESPAVMAWLPTTGLIRNFTVVVANIADGPTPAKHVKVLRPAAPFRVVSRDGATQVDPRSYDRYATIADAVASVDPAGAAKLYATLKPRIEDANRDLGSSDSFDHTLERAIVALLSTPATDGSERLKPKGHRLRLRGPAARVADAGAEAAAAHGPAQCPGRSRRSCGRLPSRSAFRPATCPRA